ncbi:MAG: hypothetical protein RL223_4899 [Pseudomonadota bacterium]|jgi:two-component system sensor histidine kinase AlgZ
MPLTSPRPRPAAGPADGGGAASSAPHDAADALAPDTSIWPQALHEAPDTRLDSHVELEAIGTFDPRQDDGAPPERAAAWGPLCEPGLVLRLLLWGSVTTLLLAWPGSDGPHDWLARSSVLLCVLLAGLPPWMAVLCLWCRHVRPRWPGHRTAWLTRLLPSLLGALVTVPGWGLLQLFGLVRPGLWPLAGHLLVGAALGLGLDRGLRLRQARHRPADARARLAELQSRIRPHFLFNALNTALALVPARPRQAETVLEDLAALFQVALAESGSAVTLADELDLARRYLAIEQMRFGERLVLSWDLDPKAARARLPPLVLQPLVENAVRHGIEPSATGGELRVRTRCWGGIVRIEVINTLPPEPGPPGSGLALANVRERLRLMHDLAGRLHTERNGERHLALIEVPLG